jgi:hypothetical protein
MSVSRPSQSFGRTGGSLESGHVAFFLLPQPKPRYKAWGGAERGHSD